MMKYNYNNNLNRLKDYRVQQEHHQIVLGHFLLCLFKNNCSSCDKDILLLLKPIKLLVQLIHNFQ
jgi:hypothetical protein